MLRDGSGYCSALKEHVRLISSHFSEYLVETGHRDLVKTKAVNLWVRYAAIAVPVSTVILTGVAAWMGLPAESIWNFMADEGKSDGPVCAAVTNLLLAGDVEVPNPDFKSFEISLRRMAS